MNMKQYLCLERKSLMRSMNFHPSMINGILLLIITTLLSCVGTIKSVDPIATYTQNDATAVLNKFQGIHSAVPIAGSKVDVFFYPIEGTLDNYTYVISYDGQQIPEFIEAKNVSPDYRGLIKYTVKNLQLNTKYNFKVQLRDITLGKESATAAKSVVSTFSNVTANFYGINEVRNLPGSLGLTGVEILWPEAEVLGNGSTRIELSDPVEYKITVLDGTNNSPADINNETFKEPVRRQFSASTNKKNLIINGLKPGTKYYIQIRCIHQGKIENSANTAYKVEENTNYLEITTYSENLNSLSFDPDSFYLSYPSGVGGLYALKANWEIPTGNFDHFRIYYAVKGTANLTSYINSTPDQFDKLCEDKEVVNNQIYCQFAPSNMNNAILSGLIPHTNYDAMVIACITATCNLRKTTYVQTKKTTPPVADFGGITTIKSTSDINELNSIKINFNLPDFKSGSISGYILEYFYDSKTYPSPTIISEASSNTSTLTIDPFNYLADTSITVRGIDYSAGTQYCFLLYPFSYDSAGEKINYRSTFYANGNGVKCITPLIEGPRINQFSGFDGNSLCDKTNHSAYLSWTPPTGGIYDSYEVFIIKGSNPSFSFVNAVADTQEISYRRITLNQNQVEYNLSNLSHDSNSVYIIGILTHYQSASSNIYSEYNLSTFTCDLRP